MDSNMENLDQSMVETSRGLQEASTLGNDVSLISGHQRISLDIFDYIHLFLLSEDPFCSIGVGFGDGIMDSEAPMVDGFEESLKTLRFAEELAEDEANNPKT
jgi:hypothetical protein